MGVPVVVPMDRTQITVYPQAQLTLKYFFQRDVFGPDPFSDVQSPSEPFSLGVIVSNVGKGTARDVSITSAQPQIVDNEKGLLVNFNIIATEANGQSLSAGLTADLGNIDPGKTAVGRWLLTSSLAGHFENYQATFQHTDALGGQQLSLITSVEIHELIHVVHMAMSGLPDFLVDDRPSSLHLPDTLYFGNGTIAPVTATGLGSVDAPVSTSHLQVQLTATLVAGYAYLQIPDPGAGNFHLVRVVRSDGTVISVDDNIWETDRTFPDGGVVPIKENLLHLLDFNSTGSYTLVYAPNDPSPPQVASIDPVVPNPRSTAVSSIDVTFSKPIDATTFDYHALTLTRNGGANLITPAVTIQALSPAQYRIGGLTGLNTAEGAYVFTVNAAAVRDPAGNLGTGSVSKTWTLATAAPPAATNIVIMPHFGMPPNDNITNTLTPMLAGQLGAANLTVSLFDLTTNTNLGQAAVTGMSFSKTLTFTAAGNHQLRIRVSNAGGNSTDSLYTLVIDITPPAISQLVNVPAGSTTKSVASIDVVFSKPIQAATFDRSHLMLTLNGGANLISNAVTITFVSGTAYRISGLGGLTQAKGAYLLTINLAGIQDLYGNVAGGTAMAGWSNVLAVTPLVLPTTEGGTFNGVVATLSDGDANTQASAYTVQINWGDGTTTTGTIQLTTPDNFNLLGSHSYAEEGSYSVTVTVRDQAGNAATATSMPLDRRPGTGRRPYSIAGSPTTSSAATTGCRPGERAPGYPIVDT